MPHPFASARVWHILFDVFLIFTALIFGYFLRVGFLFSSDVPFSPYAVISVLASAVWVVIMVSGGYYRLRQNSSGLMRWALRFAGGAGGVATLMAGHFFWSQLLFSRLMSFYGLFLGVALLWISFRGFEELCGKWKLKNQHCRKVVLVGGGRIAEELIVQAEKDPYSAIKIMGVIDPSGIHKTVKNSKILGKLNKLEGVIKKENIKEIIQCGAHEHAENVQAIADEYALAYSFVPMAGGTPTLSPRFHQIGQIPVLEPNSKKRLTAIGRVLE